MKLLGRWLADEQEQEPSSPVLVVAAYRSEEVKGSHRLRRLSPVTHLVLPRFGTEELQLMLASMAGILPFEALDVVERLSDRNPFMATAVLRGLVETGALVGGSAGWTVDARAMADVQTSRHAAAFLVRRMQLLAHPALHLLSVGAVLGKQFDRDLAGELASQTPSEVAAVVEDARRRQILWVSDEQCTFVHDKLRETLLTQLPAEERRRLHRLAAYAIEAQDPMRVFDLAYHFDAAGETANALPYALTAAAQARSQHALEVAERHYEIAERAAEGGDPGARKQSAEGLGEVLMLRGRYEEAARRLEAARALAQTPVESAQIQAKLGELAFKQGDVEGASNALEQGLGLLGRRVPRSSLGFVVAALREILVQACHTLLPRLFVGRRELDDSGADMLASRLYSRLAYAYWFQRGRMPCLWTHLRGMNLAERYQSSLELAQHYSEHAPVMTMVPYFSRGIAYAEKSFAIRKSFGDVWGQGQSLGFYGTLLYSASRYEEAIERCREAVTLLERTGDRWEVNTANWHIAFALYRLGHLGDAVAAARRVHRAGIEIGDHQASAISLGAWSKASGGDVPAHLIAEELERPDDDVHTRAELLQAEAVRLLSEGRPGDAVEALTLARRMVKQKGLQQEYVAPILPWLATALRREADSAGAASPAQRDALLRQARVAARRGVRMARKYRNNLPHALREQGVLAALKGHRRRARKLLDRSIAAAEAQGARQELAQSRLAWGRTGLRFGWPGAAAAVAEGEEAVQELTSDLIERTVPSEVTLSLVDRFESLLEVGQRLASALTPEAIYEAVQQAALILLRSEHCTVVSVTGREPWQLAVVGGNEEVFSETLVERALREAKPVVLDEGLDADAGDSLILPQVRSALCVPIYVRRHPAACLYVAHGQVGALFSEDERRLGLFIATLAGTALENAKGFADIHALSRSLEKRVRERTAELAAANRELMQQSAAVTLLQAVTAAANQASSVEQAMSVAMAQVCRYAGWPVAHVCLARPSGDDQAATHLWYAEEGAKPDGLLEALQTSAFFGGCGMGLRVQEGGRPVWVPDISSDAAVQGDGAGGLPPVAALASPILAGEEIVGALEFFAPHAAPEDERLLELTVQVGTELGRVVERQRADTALRASEARTRSIVETASQAFMGMDQTGLILDWNRQAETTFGWHRDEAIGQILVSSVLPQVGTDGFIRGLGTALGAAGQHDAGGRMEVVAVHRDGHEFPAELTIWSVPGGDAPMFYAFLHDITERRQAEDRRRASERRLREAQQLARLGSWEWDVATDALMWSPQLYSIYGLDPEEFPASYEGFMSRVHPDDRTAVNRVISDALRQSQPFEFEHRIVRPDGQVRVLQARGEPVLDADGVPLRMVGTGQDVTEARQSEDRLQRANARLAGTVRELERHDREVSVINQMGDMLQSCMSEPEAYAVIAQFAGQLFPDDAGGMGILAPNRDTLEDVAVWGSGGSAEAHFGPRDCWALRRGQIHVAGERAGSTLWCPHIGDTAVAESICVPIVAQGETLGLLHLQRAESTEPTLESRFPLAVSVADRVSLALANLRLWETLREQSLRDPLTGLFNRRHLKESLERSLRRASRGGAQIAVIVIDVDRFKQVNDELGHEAGDELLRDLGALVQSHVRDEDVACRYGGEEFVLMLRAPLDVAQRRAEELCTSARDLGTGHGAASRMSLSLGVAVFPDHGTTSDELLRAADVAMYRAKAEGRDRVVMAELPG
jgi:diguanylate cyclase (GGDEF)-like protein/PAS domain S-box-containing protein